jgi:hypothetical protein
MHDGVVPPEIDAENRFRAHKRYVEAFAWIGGWTLVTSETDALVRLAQRVA